MIIALAGRRVDAADAKSPRFPAANTQIVAQRIRTLFEQHRPQALVCSAAAGSDLLALEAAVDLAIYREIVLPFSPEVFRRVSVADRPGDWTRRFDRVLADLEPRGGITCLNARGQGEGAYLGANEVILDRAQLLGSEQNQPVWAVVVWNGVSRGDGDITLAFREAAKTANLPVIEIPTI
jgi:hypothetical protein